MRIIKYMNLIFLCISVLYPIPAIANDKGIGADKVKHAVVAAAATSMLTLGCSSLVKSKWFCAGFSFIAVQTAGIALEAAQGTRDDGDILANAIGGAGGAAIAITILSF